MPLCLCSLRGVPQLLIRSLLLLCVQAAAKRFEPEDLEV